jgi:hypothetical protein
MAFASASGGNVSNTIGDTSESAADINLNTAEGAGSTTKTNGAASSTTSTNQVYAQSAISRSKKVCSMLPLFLKYPTNLHLPQNGCRHLAS